MIRKDPHSSKIHRLKVIHLYEADLNLLLGVKWRSLTHHCIDNSLLHPGQFGGLPGRDAMTPISWKNYNGKPVVPAVVPFCEWISTPQAALTESSPTLQASLPGASASIKPSVSFMRIFSVRQSTTSRRNLD
jgi:hypothetical protein